jgi:hypothetical protein
LTAIDDLLAAKPLAYYRDPMMIVTVSECASIDHNIDKISVLSRNVDFIYIGIIMQGLAEAGLRLELKNQKFGFQIFYLSRAFKNKFESFSPCQPTASIFKIIYQQFNNLTVCQIFAAVQLLH